MEFDNESKTFKTKVDTQHKFCQSCGAGTRVLESTD
jgi:ribosomal protein S27AE